MVITDCMMPDTGIAGAVLTMMHARLVWYEVHVVDALAIYDNVAQSLAPSIFGRR